MNGAILGLLAETSVHPGSGRSMGAVDLPVSRESATDYPVLVGSGLKGALKDKARKSSFSNLDRAFGTQSKAGDLLVGDARLLMLPVRSLAGSYKWVICPQLIERYRRDLARAGVGPQPEIPHVNRGEILTECNGDIFLEERCFSVSGDPPTGLINAILPLISHKETQDRVGSTIAVLHDDDMSWFARFSLNIQARNKLDDDSKTSENLWFEETLSTDTLMYSVIIGKTVEAMEALEGLFSSGDNYLQAGGNETVGQGWFSTTVRMAVKEQEQ